MLRVSPLRLVEVSCLYLCLTVGRCVLQAVLIRAYLPQGAHRGVEGWLYLCLWARIASGHQGMGPLWHYSLRGKVGPSLTPGSLNSLFRQHSNCAHRLSKSFNPDTESVAFIKQVQPLNRLNIPYKLWVLHKVIWSDRVIPNGFATEELLECASFKMATTANLSQQTQKLITSIEIKIIIVVNLYLTSEITNLCLKLWHASL